MLIIHTNAHRWLCAVAPQHRLKKAMFRRIWFNVWQFSRLKITNLTRVNIVMITVIAWLIWVRLSDKWRCPRAAPYRCDQKPGGGREQTTIDPRWHLPSPIPGYLDPIKPGVNLANWLDFGLGDLCQPGAIPNCALICMHGYLSTPTGHCIKHDIAKPQPIYCNWFRPAAYGYSWAEELAYRCCLNCCSSLTCSGKLRQEFSLHLLSVEAHDGGYHSRYNLYNQLILNYWLNPK